MPKKEEAAPTEIEWVSPDSLSNCLKEIKSGGAFVSFGWCDPKLGESAEMVEDLCGILSKVKKLQALDFDQCKLSNSNVEIICESLKKNKSVQTIVLSNNDLGAPAAKAIDDLLKLNKSIKHVDLSDNPKIPATFMESIQAQLESRKA